MMTTISTKASTKPLRRQFLRFCLVGVFATATQYLILILLVHNFHLLAPLASSVGYVGGAVVNYFLNRKLTFQSDKKHRIAMIQFAIVVVIGFVLNAWFMFVGTEKLQLNYILSQVITTGIILCWNFLAHRFWTFK